jgi:hypothetical protein
MQTAGDRSDPVACLKSQKEMKTLELILCGLVTILATSVRAQSGGNFEITSSTVQASGVCSEGQFTLTGTAGQHDAGIARGGPFTMEGGFWHGITVVQMPDAPLLKIKLTVNGTAVLSWPVDATGWTLQECSNLAEGVWANSQHSVVDTASDHTVTVPASGVVKCYRLKK